MRELYVIKGMHCAACSSSVERVLSRNNAVSNVNVSLVSERMIIEYDEKKISTDDIINIVKKAGFSAYLYNEKDIEDKYNSKDIEIKKSYLKIVFMLIISIPIFIYIIMHIVGNHSFLLFGSYKANWYMQLIIATVDLMIARSFIINGIKSLYILSPTMDALVFISTITSYVYSIYLYISDVELIYFDSTVMILVMISIGKFLESRARKTTSKIIEDMVKLRPKFANLLVNDLLKRTLIDEIMIGDHVLVKSGEIIAIDGIILKGDCLVDESFLTGESMEVNKTVGDEVIGGSINKQGIIVVEVKKTIDNSILTNIIRLVEDAQSNKVPIGRIADKISAYFVPIIILLSIISMLTWLYIGKDFSFSLNILVSVLVIACPCALGLATPIAIVVATGTLAREGIIIKNPDALEYIKDVKTFIFDKTGTLTTGEVVLENIENYSNYEDQTLIDIVASAEYGSEHILAKAIIDKSKNIYKSTENKILSGYGILAKVEYLSEEIKVSVGNKKLLNFNEMSYSNYCIDRSNSISNKGMTPVFISFNNEIVAIFAIKDKIKNDQKQIIDYFNENNVRTLLLTGDNINTAKFVANELGIKNIEAEVLPEDKGEIVKKYKSYGKVCMVGDGINDAVALVNSDVGIAISNGCDIAIDSADIILIKNDIRDINKILKMSHKMIRNIKENLFWAFLYNIIGIPIAMGVLYKINGLLLSPMFGCIAMSLSSLFVVTNALRLRKYKR